MRKQGRKTEREGGGGGGKGARPSPSRSNRHRRTGQEAVVDPQAGDHAEGVLLRKDVDGGESAEPPGRDPLGAEGRGRVEDDLAAGPQVARVRDEGVADGRAEEARVLEDGFARVLQVQHVLPRELDLAPGPGPGQVPAQEVVEVVREHLVVRPDEARHARRHAQLRERGPAGEDDVDEHDHLLGRGPDEDVPGLVVVAPVLEFERLVADAHVLPAPEDPRRDRAVRVVHVAQHPRRLLVRDDLDARLDEQECALDVIGVRVAVDEGPDGRVGEVTDRVFDPYAQVRRAVDDDDAFVGDEEERLVYALGHDCVGPT